MTVAPEIGHTMRSSGEGGLYAEHDGLRAALAAARGTILDLRSHLSDLRAAQDFLRLSRDAAAAEVRDLRQQLAAAQTTLDHEAALLAERDWLRGVRDAQTARLRALEPLAQHAAALTTERDAALRRAEALDRVTCDLCWENGPRSVKAVLPLARLLRRLGRFRTDVQR